MYLLLTLRKNAMKKFYIVTAAVFGLMAVIAFILSIIFYASACIKACFIAQIIAGLSAAGTVIFGFLYIFHGFDGGFGDLSGAV